MKVSRERLTGESQATGFRPEVLEKVIHLLNLLEGFNRHPFLKGRLVLKGGTALNLFLFDVPRLSVDIDMNYIGAADRDTMLAERPKVEQAVQAVCSREGMNITRVPTDHAGGKWRLRYESALGVGGNLEVDLNFMFRVPLWPVTAQDAAIGYYSAMQIPVLDLHELAAGKLAALLARKASRDLFDAHQLLTRSGKSASMTTRTSTCPCWRACLIGAARDTRRSGTRSCCRPVLSQGGRLRSRFPSNRNGSATTRPAFKG